MIKQEWTEINKESLPSDFLKENKYEFQMYNSYWKETTKTPLEVIHHIMTEGNILSFRYRVKPLVDIKITREEKHHLTFAMIHMKKAYDESFLGPEHRRNCMGTAMEGIQKIIDRTEVID